MTRFADALPGLELPSPPRRGASESLLLFAMRQWDAEGVLVGAGYAAARGILRDAARAVDIARFDMAAGRGKPDVFARCNRLYLDALERLTGPPRREVHGDAIDALIANISGAPIRDEA